MHKLGICFWAASLAVVCTACSDIQETAGLARRSPDEFAVVKHPPLSVPPDFTLRPPNPNARGAAEPKPVAAEAQQLVFGATDSNMPATDGLTALLDKAGAKQAKADIRQKLDQESEGIVVKDKDFVDKLMIWNSAPTVKPDPMVKAAPEAARIQTLQSQSAPVTGQDAKVESGREKAPLEGAFE